MFASSWLLLLLAAVCPQIAYAKTVLAHFMMQEAYAYTTSQWKDDIAVAQQMGVDGFAMNWSPPDCTHPYLDWMATQVGKAFNAAEGKNFKLVHSFDMSYTTCDYNWNQTFMTSMITQNAKSSANLLWNNTILVTTYAGDSNTYGNEFFQGLKSSLKHAGTPITLSPALTTYSQGAQNGNGAEEASKLVSDYSAIDGFLNWQAWPMSSKTNLTTDVDASFSSALKSAGRTGPYIMAISPWQFKNLDSSTGSWVSYSDTLFAQRLSELATGDFQPDIVELLTWNDYGESHYLRNLPSTVVTATDYVTYSSGMNNYVQSMNHNPWRVIAKYYLAWWKNGKAPTITMDQVIFWYRTHPKTATCTGQPGVSIAGSNYPTDAVFAWALVKEASTIVLNVGSNTDYTFSADGSGPALSMVPFPSNLGGGVTPNATIERNGSIVAEGAGSVAINSGCTWYNFNPVVNLVGQGVNK